MTDSEPPSRRRGPRARRGIAGLFGLFQKSAKQIHVDALVAAAVSDGELVSQARAFQDLRVEDVMKPRADIVAVERNTPFSDLVTRFLEAEHSRMPVYRENLDEPVGVVHVKDVFRLMARKSGPPKPEVRALAGRHALVREVLYAPPSMPASKLLATMRSKRIHMALVIDEFGGVDGLVTLEDLLETLVGEIADEHDDAIDSSHDPIIADEEGWIVDGRAPLEELELAIGEGVDLAPEDVDEEIDTVAGLVNTLAGRVPQRREIIEHPDGYLIEVLAADPRRVKRVRVRRTPDPAVASPDA